MTYNATLTAICELIEDAGLPASEIRNLIANIPDELEGRAEQRWVAEAADQAVALGRAAVARMKEAAR